MNVSAKNYSSEIDRNTCPELPHQKNANGQICPNCPNLPRLSKFAPIDQICPVIAPYLLNLCIDAELTYTLKFKIHICTYVCMCICVISLKCNQIFSRFSEAYFGVGYVFLW